ncbi:MULTISPECIES: copper amine oxidase N-terminal domain-containing protein [unclassified Fusibacter]|uniref:copper amine oxidase N-terminal domain-containing protein n=1 Tax=unclassified Fusibacter TaxID=2624464 RepID=UPI0010121D86|nr:MULTISPECIES: copper amine oxidase N-terminal domain-containing protein [unclassified Fusibacter]MCK8061184.1 copper amine oxidase N-terminal domain-containing protein [Fusibacter sp. A2]NPE23279.1 copper amine oxidase N-terminal domain-containing protein [Fusibacter sp. A1]RXV59322.1 copper amine oxidase N-terminal domain-containing protein [Fusibacter sp. A1]
MKKILALTLALLMTFSSTFVVLAAPGGNGKGNGQTSGGDTTKIERMQQLQEMKALRKSEQYTRKSVDAYMRMLRKEIQMLIAQINEMLEGNYDGPGTTTSGAIEIDITTGGGIDLDLYTGDTETLLALLAQLQELRKDINLARFDARAFIRASYSPGELEYIQNILDGIYSRYSGFTALPVDSIVMEDVTFKFDVPPLIKNGRTLIPVRSIAEGLGAVVTWDGVKQEVTIVRENKVIILTIGESVAKVGTVNPGNDFVEVPFDSQAEIVMSRTILPLRFIAETFGLTVEWDAQTRTIIIIE